MPGDDVVDGGAGEDQLSFSLSPAAVVVDLAAGTASGEGEDQLIGIERVEGSPFDDRLMGSAAADWMAGLDGDDEVFGRAGDDFLDGGPGFDFVDGGDGFDHCFAAEEANACEEENPT